ncbi:hypothetical protein DFH09DRAFT_1252659 [Mycena vulgaris]|nr:hypothetical protein DFH09DRAFT_1252659 [Mycena vulgaris]
MAPLTCTFCVRTFPHGAALRIHQSRAPACKAQRDAHLETLMAQAMQASSIPDEETPSDDEDNSEQPLSAPAVNILNPAGIYQEQEIDKENFWYFEDFPKEEQAGATFGEGPTTFQTIRDDQILQGAEILGPFENDEEWELAKWLIKNVGHNQMEAFLKLPIIEGLGTAYSSKDQVLQAIDNLPGGVGWKLEKVVLKGDLQNDDGKQIVETLEMWYRDPVDCIRELMGNSVFRDVMQYAPQQVFEDREGKSEVINEMWTASWCSHQYSQKLLPPSAIIAPIILSSDKTKLSNFRGDQSAWPVYLTIGNISKDIRCQVSSHATIFVGYLPIGKYTGYSDKARQAVRYRTFHHCMSVITRSLISAGTDSVDMTCADGFVCWVWPILAAYNRCPICKVKPTSRGSHEPSAPRDQTETIELLREHQSGYKNPSTAAKSKENYDVIGLRPVYAPFWAQLPHSDIFQVFTPDLLHQLHKGVFKDHLVKWCTKIVGEKENGILSVSQWTGSEFKAMEKVFISVLAGAVPERVIAAARAILDFIYYSSLQSHRTATLLALASSLDNFHRFKDIFITLEARADGFNMESPECLHIDYAKNAYRASNKHDYIIQMTQWLRRQEAVDRFTLYLEWVRNGGYKRSEDVSCTLITPPVLADPEGVVVHQPTRAAPSKTYQIAKTHPSELTNIPAADIIAGHDAVYFLEAVKAYISPHSNLIPQPFDRFNLYKEANCNNHRNIVRVTPPVPARGVRSPAQPAYLNFALMGPRFTVLFQLPEVFRLQTAHPLAYVEWYTPFSTPDPVSGLFTVKRSTQNNHVYGEIIGIDRIVRNCHLLPKFGRKKDSTWTTENVVERCTAFFPSQYSDIHSFCLFRVGKNMYTAKPQ